MLVIVGTLSTRRAPSWTKDLLRKLVPRELQSQFPPCGNAIRGDLDQPESATVSLSAVLEDPVPFHNRWGLKARCSLPSGLGKNPMTAMVSLRWSFMLI
ncbi:hypothetical protein ACOME3_002583 [Neoechinorhynchus agilis]